jgi:hypothetical protein
VRVESTRDFLLCRIQFGEKDGLKNKSRVTVIVTVNETVKAVKKMFRVTARRLSIHNTARDFPTAQLHIMEKIMHWRQKQQK